MATIQQKRELNTKCLQETYKALKLVEKGISKAEVARKFQEITLSTWIFKAVDGGNNPKRRRLREGTYADIAIDKVIFKWLLTVRSRNVPVSTQGSTEALKEKTLNFAREIKVENFSASDGWVTRWKVRFHIPLKKVSGEGNACTSEITATWTENSTNHSRQLQT